MPAKKKTTKRVATKRVAVKRPAPMRSFQVVDETVPFLTFRFTDQTVYWSILLVMILALGLWVLNIQISITDILNTIH